ncbi:unnamed protein product [Phyllotreta striolata]|uniref:Uncharacterized protein n=1 Tax=Phyllotreta striolata TaxID=444603 RepID=A0A9N9XPH0_PHYSR|nr:unnamed protein product [Phyllotreta striolata]
MTQCRSICSCCGAKGSCPCSRKRCTKETNTEGHSPCCSTKHSATNTEKLEKELVSVACGEFKAKEDFWDDLSRFVELSRKISAYARTRRSEETPSGTEERFACSDYNDTPLSFRASNILSSTPRENYARNSESSHRPHSTYTRSVPTTDCGTKCCHCPSDVSRNFVSLLTASNEETPRVPSTRRGAPSTRNCPATIGRRRLNERPLEIYSRPIEEFHCGNNEEYDEIANALPVEIQVIEHPDCIEDWLDIEACLRQPVLHRQSGLYR